MRTRFICSSEIEEAQIQAILELSVNMSACGIGAPPEVLRRAKALGETTLALIGSPHHVQRAVAAGVDMLVALGYGARAHTGPIGTYSMVPQIVDAAGDVPVLVAGGVATGRHVATGLAMGAAGAWIGIAWLLSEEHQAHMRPVNTGKLKAAESGDTVTTRSESGKNFGPVGSAWSQEWESEDAPTQIKDALSGHADRRFIRRNRRTSTNLLVEPLTHSGAGQSIGYFDEVRTLKVIIDDLVKEASEVLSLQASFQNKRFEADIFK